MLYKNQSKVHHTYMIDGLHRKVKGHELANGLQTGHRSSDRNAGESHFGNWRINHALVAILFPKTAGNLEKNISIINTHF